MLESSTGDSSKEDGLKPGGIVRHGDLEIGSFAGDINLYLETLGPVPYVTLESDFPPDTVGGESTLFATVPELRIAARTWLVELNRLSNVSANTSGDLEREFRIS